MDFRPCPATPGSLSAPNSGFRPPRGKVEGSGRSPEPSSLLDLLAEREGFEPPETFQPLPISSSALKALSGAVWARLVMPGMRFS